MIPRLALFVLLCSCLAGPPRATCVLDDDCAAGNACFEGSCCAGFHQDGGLTWRPRLEPRLSDIDQRLSR